MILSALGAAATFAGYWRPSLPLPIRLPSPARTDAVDALRGLRSVTEVGVNYMEYARRVQDAKIRVDRYLDSASSFDSERNDIAEVMKIHAIALSMWGHRINSSGIMDIDRDDALRILNDPVIEALPEVALWIKVSRNLWNEQHAPGYKYSSLVNQKETIDDSVIECLARNLSTQQLWADADIILAKLR